jgi:glycosyltransferase involved in cell wall biosynthesis
MIYERPLAVVPAFNEAATVRQVVSALKSEGLSVLVVDDGSRDETSKVAEESGATVLRLPLNLGVGGALRAAFRFAVEKGYTAVVQVDADGQHPAHQIPDLEKAAVAQNAHLVIGSRYLSRESTLTQSGSRRLAMRLLSRLVTHAAGRRITDSTSGFRLIRQPLLSEFAAEFPSYYLGDTYEATVAAARAGYEVIEIPAALRPRSTGVSSATSARAIVLIAKVLVITVFRLHPKIRRLAPERLN